MPELPEVETVRRGLAPTLIGAQCISAATFRPALRFALPDRFCQKMRGRRFVALERRAKYLLARLDDGHTLLMHLGMSGSMRIEQVPGGARRTHDHVVLCLMPQGGGPPVSLIYNDPRRFGFMLLAGPRELGRCPLLARLGIEPLSPDFDAGSLASRFAGRRISLKAALLDQRLIVGIGNIYASEALFEACLSPRRSAASLARAGGRPGRRAQRLAQAIQTVLNRAIEAGGASLRDHRRTDGTTGWFQHEFQVYGRQSQPCLRGACGGSITRVIQNGRASYFCPRCQR